MDPMVLTATIGLAYLTLLLVPVLPFVRAEDSFSGSRLVGFLPTLKPALLYVGGLLVLAACYWFVVKRRSGERGSRVEVPPWVVRLVWITYGLAIVANLLALLDVGGVPLFDIDLRQQLSPKLVWVASWQITLVPALLVVLIDRLPPRSLWLRWLSLAGVSLVLLSLFGARNAPLKLLVALAVIVGLHVRLSWRQLAAIGAVPAVVFVLVGALSKSQIYAGDQSLGASAAKAVNQAYLDSAGMFFRLEIVVGETDEAGFLGLYRGRLLADTALNIVPGVQRLYANYQIGELVGEHETEYLEAWEESGPSTDALRPIGLEDPEPGGFQQPSRLVDLRGLPVSQASTIVGPGYADLGLLGLGAQMALVGAVMGLLRVDGARHRMLWAFLAGLTGHVVAGINLGLHAEHAILMLSTSILALLVAGGTKRRLGVPPRADDQPTVPVKGQR